MTIDDSIVYIVDDDPLIRDSLAQLVKSVGLKVETFSSARAFLDKETDKTPCCLVLDIRMPGLSGLDLQQALQADNRMIPIIFITGHGTVPVSVQAMKAGAVDFLQKPFEDQELLDGIHQAIQRNRAQRISLLEKKAVIKRFDSLTPREHEVLDLVRQGFLNKQIADKLGMTENTVKSHRRRIMQKMEADSLASLIRKIISIS